MSKMSELPQVLDDLISCGEKMIQTANAIKECFTAEDAPAAEPEKKAKPAKKEAKAPEAKMSEHYLLPKPMRQAASSKPR